MLRTGKVYFYEFKFETAVNPNILNTLNGSNYRDYTLPISIQCKYHGAHLNKGADHFNLFFTSDREHSLTFNLYNSDQIAKIFKRLCMK